MSALLPSLEAEQFRRALTNFLTTTFAFADTEAEEELDRLLTDPDRGIFRGPYARLRLPFEGAADGWQELLAWTPPYPPHAHQAAAWRRLTSRDLGDGDSGPHPTLVTTGTGSGKTEAFLYPVLDHVVRMKAAGQGGIKALILYPMNALANDQARRIASLITGVPQLRGIRAALYTGQTGSSTSKVTAESLITSRDAIRDDPPDILLTNYKMLDQLLLRHSDRKLWAESAESLRYLVLDEFHTYDGAQGTDVAMLLRRLGLVLKRWLPAATDDAILARPLGYMTPVATSATLGDKGDPEAMMAFAQTVFGVEFTPEDVVTETRLSVTDWAGSVEADLAAFGILPAELTNHLAREINAAVEGVSNDEERAHIVLTSLFTDPGALGGTDLLSLVKAHPALRELIALTERAIKVDDLAESLLPRGYLPSQTETGRAAERRVFVANLLAALSHVRAAADFGQALDVNVHLWVRELTRMDRHATAQVFFDWRDDGDATPAEEEPPTRFPALYCRHCGRSGWGVVLAPIGNDLEGNGVEPGAQRLAGNGRFRALIHAPREGVEFDEGTPVDGLHWLEPRQRQLLASAGETDEALPVLAITGEGAEEAARNDVCPSCGRAEGIRFVGSAIATQLSVAITTLFGDPGLTETEKKTLVFTDSVQDAAHRAGFVQSRAHVFALRNAITRAVASSSDPLNLSDLVDLMIEQADTPSKRYLLLAPEIAGNDNFVEFWNETSKRRIGDKVKRRVRRRLLLDVALEFGLQSRVGRTLELTGAVAAGVSAGDARQLETIGRKAIATTLSADALDIERPEESLPETTVLWWIRGVLERLRERGAIDHPWYQKYIADDGARWFISGGRPRGEGMPAFPEGRDAPAYPRLGSRLTPERAKKSGLDNALNAQSWYSTWARDTLGVTAQTGTHLTRALLAELERAHILTEYTTKSSATVYAIPEERVTVTATDLSGWESGSYLLTCPVCENKVVGREEVVDQLNGAPCTSPRCAGSLQRALGGDNYYRTLYTSGDMRRVVAREHTGLLTDADRLRYETQFKASAENPDAPNVLVATPTLEMGIDIGDLSTVMLAGLPRSVASYLQRVGRAGRLTGNALNLAFVSGRGDQLPRLAEPLSVIDGAVLPPATYLNAEEILQRQYLASVLDRRAAGAASVDQPNTAGQALASAAAGTFLGDLVADAEGNAAEYVQQFLAAFHDLEPWAIESLTTWATPTAGEGTSPLAATVYSAVHRWQARLEQLTYRLQQVEASLPDLKQKAEHPAAEENDKIDYRAALSAQRGISRQIGETRREHWVGALEALGLLPNYTLLDDSVRLDVALSWYDPDSNAYETETSSYERGASTAIRELAPGAVFYAHGLEMTVDAIELGADGGNVHEWQLCPSCGFGLDLTLADAPVTSCPRCGDAKIADTGQRLPILPLERVSAEVRRDESAITDRADERRQQNFTVYASADVDPANVTSQWYVEGKGIAVRFCRDMPIRWINLGPQSQGGLPKFLAGEELKTPLFRVCRLCGKLDRSTNANSRTEHRAWCPNRTSTQEDAKQLALMRELRTQGLVLRVPPAVSLDRGLQLHSLMAALLLGLRETIGGDPDHLRVEPITDPVLSDGSENATALLIHDAVPGGTGYLADLAAPERIRRVFDAAYTVVRDCPCQGEGKAACYRCLLPFAPGRAARNISRAAAEQILAELLTDGKENPAAWVVVEQEPPKPEPPLESAFRAVLKDRLQTLGASLAESVDANGQRLTATLPGGVVWVLREQVLVGGIVKPDFVLEMFGSPHRMAIFTDGQRYHAAPDINRIADDSAKRRWLRDAGYLVFAVTWDDVDHVLATTAAQPPGWFDLARATQLAQMWNIPAHALSHVVKNPIDQIIEYVQDPGVLPTWQSIGAALPMLLWDGATFHDLGGAPVKRWAADVLLETAAGIGAQAPPLSVMTRRDFVVLAARSNSPTDFDAALVLDDRAAAVAQDDFGDAWRTWLRWSNLLGIRPAAASTFIGASSEVLSAPLPFDVAAEPQVPSDWAGLIAGATAAERPLLTQLAMIDGVPIPELGVEVGDGIPLAICWPGRQLAADLGVIDEDRAQLGDLGWSLIAPDAAVISEALQAEG
ncbi:DEAD/DEAH box helicase [Leifsonia sp. NPDC058194]|uniref:DEAD/DEAH box helicase n=1 Tax=Leifsonia sp. NPDC058194 TaxID=3346374 RepID=UPI0036DCFDAA